MKPQPKKKIKQRDISNPRTVKESDMEEFIVNEIKAFYQRNAKLNKPHLTCNPAMIGLIISKHYRLPFPQLLKKTSDKQLQLIEFLQKMQDKGLIILQKKKHNNDFDILLPHAFSQNKNNEWNEEEEEEEEEEEKEKKRISSDQNSPSTLTTMKKEDNITNEKENLSLSVVQKSPRFNAIKVKKKTMTTTTTTTTTTMEVILSYRQKIKAKECEQKCYLLMKYKYQKEICLVIRATMKER